MLHRHSAHGEAVARITEPSRTRPRTDDRRSRGRQDGGGARRAGRARPRPQDRTWASPAQPHHRRPRHPRPSSPPWATPPVSHRDAHPQATDALATEYAERGRIPILVVDEAHLLTHPQLEALRMLTNHRMDSGACSPACSWVNRPSSASEARRARRTRSTYHRALPRDRDEPALCNWTGAVAARCKRTKYPFLGLADLSAPRPFILFARYVPG